MSRELALKQLLDEIEQLEEQGRLDSDVRAYVHEAAKRLGDVQEPWMPKDDPNDVDFGALVFAHAILTGMVPPDQFSVEQLAQIKREGAKALQMVLQLHQAGGDLPKLAAAAKTSRTLELRLLEERLAYARQLRTKGADWHIKPTVIDAALYVVKQMGCKDEEIRERAELLRVAYQKSKAKPK